MITFRHAPVLLLTSAVALSAQTAAPKAPIHHATAATPHKSVAATPACATDIPTISSKIPALPAGLACPRPIYTITRRPDLIVDYMSPMVSPETRKALTFLPTTFSLDYVDTVIGKGELLQPGKDLSVHYTGYLPDGTKFDSSVDRGEPISFPYGQHRVIQGWDTGFEGMHVGGKRRLFIPYQLAYGEAGHPPTIPAKSWLVFDVELVGQGDTPTEPTAPPVRPAASTQPAATQPQPAARPATPPPAQSTTPDSAPASKP
jgi:peptidylprolyl isomerase